MRKQIPSGAVVTMWSRLRNSRLVKALLMVGGLTGAGCASFNDKRGLGDAPVGVRLERPVLVVENINDHPNYSIECPTSRVAFIGTTREAAPIVLSGDDAEELCLRVAATLEKHRGQLDADDIVKVDHLECVGTTSETGPGAGLELGLDLGGPC